MCYKTGQVYLLTTVIFYEIININYIGADAMIHARDHKTPYLFDPWNYLGSKRRKLLDESWTGLFREHILPNLPVHKIASCYARGFGRPTKKIFAALGSLILQQGSRVDRFLQVFQVCFLHLPPGFPAVPQHFNHVSVGPGPSQNRTCRFPASGSSGRFTNLRHKSKSNLSLSWVLVRENALVAPGILPS